MWHAQYHGYCLDISSLNNNFLNLNLKADNDKKSLNITWLNILFKNFKQFKCTFNEIMSVLEWTRIVDIETFNFLVAII